MMHNIPHLRPVFLPFWRIAFSCMAAKVYIKLTFELLGENPIYVDFSCHAAKCYCHLLADNSHMLNTSKHIWSNFILLTNFLTLKNFYVPPLWHQLWRQLWLQIWRQLWRQHWRRSPPMAARAGFWRGVSLLAAGCDWSADPSEPEPTWRVPAIRCYPQMLLGCETTRTCMIGDARIASRLRYPRLQKQIIIWKHILLFGF